VIVLPALTWRRLCKAMETQDLRYWLAIRILVMAQLKPEIKRMAYAIF